MDATTKQDGHDPDAGAIALDDRSQPVPIEQPGARGAAVVAGRYAARSIA